MQWSMDASSTYQTQINWNLQPVWKMFEDPLTARQIRIQLLDYTDRAWWNLDGPLPHPKGAWSPSTSPIDKDVSAFLKAGSGFRLVITNMTGQVIAHPVTLVMVKPGTQSILPPPPEPDEEEEDENQALPFERMGTQPSTPLPVEPMGTQPSTPLPVKPMGSSSSP